VRSSALQARRPGNGPAGLSARGLEEDEIRALLRAAVAESGTPAVRRLRSLEALRRLTTVRQALAGHALGPGRRRGAHSGSVSASAVVASAGGALAFPLAPTRDDAGVSPLLPGDRTRPGGSPHHPPPPPPSPPPPCTRGRLTAIPLSPLPCTGGERAYIDQQTQQDVLRNHAAAITATCCLLLCSK